MDSGKIVTKKDPIQAIEGFEKAQEQFDRLVTNHKIPLDALPTYLHLQLRAQLERASLHEEMAQTASPIKKQLYLEYAESILHKLKEHLTPLTPLIKDTLFTHSAYPKILQETDFLLQDIYQKKGEKQKAVHQLNLMLANYEAAHIDQGSLLAKVWIEKGKSAYDNQEYRMAQNAFQKAHLLTNHLPLFSTEETLRIWILEALCNKALGEYDESMRSLSNVVNHPTISHLRVEAMVHRADLYLLEGKPELALKQLKAASIKSGKWGEIAKDRLNKE